MVASALLPCVCAAFGRQRHGAACYTAYVLRGGVRNLLGAEQQLVAAELSCVMYLEISLDSQAFTAQQAPRARESDSLRVDL